MSSGQIYERAGDGAAISAPVEEIFRIRGGAPIPDRTGELGGRARAG